MEQKAKRVGKFNIIDIIAVILIVAVVAFGAWKLLGSSGGTAAEDGGMWLSARVCPRSCTRPARPICPLR